MADISTFFFLKEANARQLKSLKGALFSFAHGASHGVPFGRPDGHDVISQAIKVRGAMVIRRKIGNEVVVPDDCRQYILVLPFAHGADRVAEVEPDVRIVRVEYDHLIPWINAADLHATMWLARKLPRPLPPFPLGTTSLLAHTPVSAQAARCKGVTTLCKRINHVAQGRRLMDMKTLKFVFGDNVNAHSFGWWELFELVPVQPLISPGENPDPFPVSHAPYPFSTDVARRYAEALHSAQTASASAATA